MTDCLQQDMKMRICLIVGIIILLVIIIVPAGTFDSGRIPEHCEIFADMAPSLVVATR